MRRTAEHAYSFKLGLCGDPQCRALHFNLERENGEHFATMTIGVEHVAQVTERMKNFAYQITTRDP